MNRKKNHLKQIDLIDSLEPLDEHKIKVDDLLKRR